MYFNYVHRYAQKYCFSVSLSDTDDVMSQVHRTLTVAMVMAVCRGPIGCYDLIWMIPRVSCLAMMHDVIKTPGYLRNDYTYL